MLLNLLEKLSENLKNYKLKLEDTQVKELAIILEQYQNGVVPMSVIRRELDLEISEVQDLMVFLESIGVLKSVFKVYCSEKSEIVREEIYDDIRKIPKKYCDKCDNGCLYLENVIVVFKVVL